MPKVSVIIPTHNRATFLQAAIASVLRQTFQDFEVIVVDDASQDKTPEVVRGFLDQRIRYIRHEINKGQGASRNIGIQQASGEFIALLDDDDEWLPAKLDKQILLLERDRDIGMVYTGFCKVDARTHQELGRIVPEKRGFIFEDLCVRNWIGTCSTVMIRRVCFEEAGMFDEGLPSGVDYDMWLRVAKQFRVEYIGEPLVLYTVHNQSISTNYDIRIRGAEAQLKKYGAFFAKRGNSRRFLSLGVHYCYQGDLTKGRAAFYRGIRSNPFELRHYFNLCLSLLGSERFRKVKRLKESYSIFFR